MKSIIVIPARYGATRFPGKSLARIKGQPMLQWVWEAACKSRLTEQVIVATDDDRIADVAAKFGADVVMTKRSHRSGTDRIAEVADKVSAQLYVNVQGDEPLLSPGAVDDLIRGMAESPRIPIGTLAHRIESEAEWRSPEVVKVVCNRHGEALYFSRSPLPFMRAWDAKAKLLRHVGIYAYRAKALATSSGRVAQARARWKWPSGKPRAAARAGARHEHSGHRNQISLPSASIRPQICARVEAALRRQWTRRRRPQSRAKRRRSKK